MKNQPLVSVIIPVYNAEKYLKECVDSVIIQTYEKLDIVLVDDGSKDNSLKICNKYYKNDERVQVIRKENGGPMSACIAGVQAAKGEYFMFMDSDDWIDIDTIEELVGKTSQNKKEMICSNYIIEKANQSIPIKQSMKPGVYDRTAIEKQLFPVILGNEERRIHGSRCMKLISRELIINNLAHTDLNVTMGEDLYLIFLAILDAERIVVVEDGYYYHYRFVDSSLVHRYKPHMYQEVRQLYDYMQKVIESKVTEEVQKKVFLQKLKQEYIFLFFFVLKNELRGPKENCCLRVQKYIEEEKKHKNLEQVDVTVKGKANQLLYFVWKKPSVFRISAVRFVIQIFDRL